MRPIEEIMIGLDCKSHECEGCPYNGKRERGTACISLIYNDCKEAVPFLAHENEKLKEQIAGKPVEHSGYWDNICRMNARQEAKGMEKYGEPLEENTTLTTTQRIEHAQEEAIDLLKYLEHLKQVVDSDGITANDYQRAALRTAKGMVFGEDKTRFMLMNAALGMAGESGEVADIVKKHTFQGHDLDVNHVAEEIGDVLWYVAIGAEAIGLSLGEVAQMNIEKLKRRYPDGFDKSRSINREEAHDKN